MTLPLLQNDEWLYLLLFGPGFGESLVVRIPPDRWIVIDSLERREGGTSWIPALEARGPARTWSGVVLTHPHKDHAGGLADLLDSADPQGFVGCVGVNVDPPENWVDSVDPEVHRTKSAVEAAVAAIRDRWETAPRTRWELVAGAEKRIKAARLRVLHPDKTTIRKHAAGPPPDPNVLSVAFLVEWYKTRLLLGGDVLRAGWARVPPDSTRDCQALKLPHHGSDGARHKVFLGGPMRGRTWMISPYSPSSLPRFEDGRGLAVLLHHVEEVQLTSLAEMSEIPVAGPRRIRRSDVLRGRIPGVRRRRVGAVLTRSLPAPSHSREAWIALGFDRHGTLQDQQWGRAAVVVTEG